MNIKQLRDLGLVAALMSKGYQPVERQKEGKQITFLFETDDNFEDLCRSYFENHLEVDAFTFHVTLKSLKQSIYTATRE